MEDKVAKEGIFVWKRINLFLIYLILGEEISMEIMEEMEAQMEKMERMEGKL